MRSGGEGRTFLNLLVEVALIAVGVFLALWANNWHEEREHRALARAALRNFLAEMETNRGATLQYRDYHVTLRAELDKFLRSAEPATEDRMNNEVHFLGVRPVIFEHTAWDLALATQALAYVEPGLAFDVSKVYTKQNAFQTLENSFLASAFAPATTASSDEKAFANSIKTYLGDVNFQEPEILKLYDQVIPEIKHALGDNNK